MKEVSVNSNQQIITSRTELLPHSTLMFRKNRNIAKRIKNHIAPQVFRFLIFNLLYHIVSSINPLNHIPSHIFGAVQCNDSNTLLSLLLYYIEKELYYPSQSSHIINFD